MYGINFIREQGCCIRIPVSFVRVLRTVEGFCCIQQINRTIELGTVETYTRYVRASGSHRCVGTLEAPTSYGNNRLCLRAVGARKLVEILIKGAIPLLPTDKYELHPQCSHPLLLSSARLFLPFRQMKMEKTCCAMLLTARQICGFFEDQDWTVSL